MRTVRLTNMDLDYLALAETIKTDGAKTSPRGAGTYELEDVLLELANPRIAMPHRVGRKLSTKILAAETMQWLAGVSDLVQLADVSAGKFTSFSDDGETLYGAYGPRASAGLLRAERLLRADPDSRRAVVSIWRTEEADETADLPCTLSWGFRIRNGKLNMSTTMRSWDVFTGLAYDLPAMTRIQSALAWSLGVEVGTYVHYAHSLHLYEADVPKFEVMRYGADSLEQPPMLSDGVALDPDHPALEITGSSRMKIMMDLSRAVVEGRITALDLAVFPSFAWYDDRLKETARGGSLSPDGYYRALKPTV